MPKSVDIIMQSTLIIFDKRFNVSKIVYYDYQIMR